ncbi:MAG TPA: GNAT family protein [Streptosporangiaceae bacterium]|nr:GNAT family protein [Streptosporangiaceae bacterium]
MLPNVEPALSGGQSLRILVEDDAALLVDATSGESAPALWGPRPAGPYSPDDAAAALAEWDRAAGGQFSVGILEGERLLGAVGVMPDGPGSAELAYWIRPEDRGRGIATASVRAVARWAGHSLGIARVWLEIRPGNAASLRVAERAGFRFEARLPRHCRDWSADDAEHDSWHDCLIWIYSGDRDQATARPDGR